MARTRRYIRAERPFELEIRVKEGLPFACLEVVKLLLKSAMARAQRDNKIKICHYNWLANHLHMLFIPYDAEKCIFFYQELQKKITEYMKRLLGVRRLALWEGDPVLAEILDFEKALDRIAYLYANPASANLVDSIDEYPGLSSWVDFLEAGTQVDSVVSHSVPWVRLPNVKKLPSLVLSTAKDLALYEELVATSDTSHELAIYPYALLSCFGTTEMSDIKSVRERIINKVRTLETYAREVRKQTGKSVIGVVRLLKQKIMAFHLPPPRERRIYVHASDTKERIEHISAVKMFCSACKICYRAWKAGECTISWPSGAIRPALRPCANAVASIESVVAAYSL